MKYIIEFESAHWAGPPDHCIVEAESAEDAEHKASGYMQDFLTELYSSEYEDEPDLLEDCAYTVNSVEPLETSNMRKYAFEIEEI